MVSELNIDNILESIYTLDASVKNYHDLKILHHAIENKLKSMQKEIKEKYPTGKHEIDDYILYIENVKRTIIDYEKAKQHPELQKTIEYKVVKVFKKQLR